MTLVFTSALDKTHRDELEELMFFHPEQGRFASNILRAVEQHGSPRVTECEGKLRIELPSITGVQTLFAVMQDIAQLELVGVVVYTRTSAGVIEILHIAVKDEYTGHGPRSDQQVAFSLIQELCRIARQIRGVHSVQLAYKRNRVLLKTELMRT
jgi:predicted GNAT family acetyltransferase